VICIDHCVLGFPVASAHVGGWRANKRDGDNRVSPRVSPYGDSGYFDRGTD
jgi:hypothetical protein